MNKLAIQRQFDCLIAFNVTQSTYMVSLGVIINWSIRIYLIMVNFQEFKHVLRYNFMANCTADYMDDTVQWKSAMHPHQTKGPTCSTSATLFSLASFVS